MQPERVFEPEAWRVAVVVCFIVAAVVTPPSVASHLVVAGVLIGLWCLVASLIKREDESC